MKTLIGSTGNALAAKQRAKMEEERIRIMAAKQRKEKVDKILNDKILKGEI